jgi:hypothetical protein
MDSTAQVIAQVIAFPASRIRPTRRRRRGSAEVVALPAPPDPLRERAVALLDRMTESLTTEGLVQIIEMAYAAARLDSPFREQAR